MIMKQIMHQSTVRKHTEVVVDLELDTITIEDIKETIPIEAEADTKAIKTMGNLSTWMTEAIIFRILMGTPLMHLKSLIQLSLFILQLWKIPKVTEAEVPQEAAEDPIEDTDQDRAEVLNKDMDQVEEQTGEHREEMTTDKDQIEDQEEDKDLIEDQEEDKNLIEDSEEDKVKDNDPTEAHGEDQTEDIEEED